MLLLATALLLLAAPALADHSDTHEGISACGASGGDDGGHDHHRRRLGHPGHEDMLTETAQCGDWLVMIPEYGGSVLANDDTHGVWIEQTASESHLKCVLAVSPSRRRAAHSRVAPLARASHPLARPTAS